MISNKNISFDYLYNISGMITNIAFQEAGGGGADDYTIQEIIDVFVNKEK